MLFSPGNNSNILSNSRLKEFCWVLVRGFSVVTLGVVSWVKNGTISPISDGKSGAGSVLMTSLKGSGVAGPSGCVMKSSGLTVGSKRSSATGSLLSAKK